MKRRIVIIIVVTGCLIGWFFLRQPHPRTNLDGMALRILVPSKTVKPDGTVSAFLILSNGSPQSIKFSKLAVPDRGESGDWLDVMLRPGYFESDPPPSEMFLKSIETLLPGEQAQWPFEMFVGTNQTLQVTAHYIATAHPPQYPEAELWPGYVDAEPLTIWFGK